MTVTTNELHGTLPLCVACVCVCVGRLHPPFIRNHDGCIWNQVSPLPLWDCRCLPYRSPVPQHHHSSLKSTERHGWQCVTVTIYLSWRLRIDWDEVWLPVWAPAVWACDCVWDYLNLCGNPTARALPCVGDAVLSDTLFVCAVMYSVG